MCRVGQKCCTGPKNEEGQMCRAGQRCRTGQKCRVVQKCEAGQICKAGHKCRVGLEEQRLLWKRNTRQLLWKENASNIEKKCHKSLLLRADIYVYIHFFLYSFVRICLYVHTNIHHVEKEYHRSSHLTASVMVSRKPPHKFQDLKS